MRIGNTLYVKCNELLYYARFMACEEYIYLRAAVLVIL